MDFVKIITDILKKKEAAAKASTNKVEEPSNAPAIEEKKEEPKISMDELIDEKGKSNENKE